MRLSQFLLGALRTRPSRMFASEHPGGADQRPRTLHPPLAAFGRAAGVTRVRLLSYSVVQVQVGYA